MKSLYKNDRLTKLKDVILEYVNKNDSFPTFQELRRTYKDETNTVIGDYKGYDNFLKAYGLYELKVELKERQIEEELEVLEDLASKLSKNMLNKGEVKEKYPEHYKVFMKHYHNKVGGYAKFIKDYGLKDNYKIIYNPLQSFDEEEKTRYYENKIKEIIEPLLDEDKLLKVSVSKLNSYRKLAHYSTRINKTLSQALEDLGYINKEKYYSDKIIKLLDPLANNDKEINEYLSKLNCFPSLSYYAKNLGKTTEEAVKDLGYKTL